MDTERYSRQIMLPEIGAEGQEKLAAARVAIIGLGGLGSPAATYLAGAGVGQLVLVDPDIVSLSNLQRQVLYSETDTGLPKTDRALKRLQNLNRDIRIDTCRMDFDQSNARGILKGCDLAVDCTDNYPTRYLLDDVCEELDIPWVYGSIGEFSGQAAVFGYKSGIRYRDLYPDREELCALARTTRGVLGAVPGVIGAIEANEAVKIITGAGEPLDGRLFSIDLLTMETTVLDLRPPVR